MLAQRQCCWSEAVIRIRLRQDQVWLGLGVLRSWLGRGRTRLRDDRFVEEHHSTSDSVLVDLGIYHSGAIGNNELVVT